jgi:hypothetical protein
MNWARASPLVPPPKRRFERQLLQHVLHRDPLTEDLKVYAWHRTTSSPVNREEEPVFLLGESPSFATRAEGTVCRRRRGRNARGSLATSDASEAPFPGRHGSPVLSIRCRIVAVRRITATRAILDPRRRLIL